MSLEDFEQMNWEAIIKRVRSGMTRDVDGDWLCQYHQKLLDELEAYKQELDKAGNVLVDPDWRFGGDERIEE